MIELLDRQKRLTANQWKLIVTGNLADLLDFFDFFLIGMSWRSSARSGGSPTGRAR
jgi:hypothetical protein